MLNDVTRFVRLRADVTRTNAQNGQTLFFGVPAAPVVLDHAELFNRHQRRLAQLLAEHPNPGIAVFALHASAGLAGHCWIAATDALRAATVGRHTGVDLFLRDDPSLSLRHLLVLVRRTFLGTRVRIADLVTATGFEAEHSGRLRALEADGPLALRVGAFSLLVLPTGEPLPWRPEALDAWSTLPPRILRSQTAPLPRAAPLARAGVRQGAETLILGREGLTQAGPEPLLEPGERIEGVLSLQSGTAQQLNVGARALERGIAIGRDPRCAGEAGGATADVSRVHAVLLRCDDALHLVDAGSSNGTFDDGQRIKLAVVAPGREYRLGTMRLCWTLA